MYIQCIYMRISHSENTSFYILASSLGRSKALHRDNATVYRIGVQKPYSLLFTFLWYPGPRTKDGSERSNHQKGSVDEVSVNVGEDRADDDALSAEWIIVVTSKRSTWHYSVWWALPVSSRCAWDTWPVYYFFYAIHDWRIFVTPKRMLNT